MHCRVYLLDAQNRVRAAESFSATDDRAAAEIAWTLYEAVGDAFEGHELWCGPQRIATNLRPCHPSARLTPLDLMRMRQEAVIDLEDRLQSTFDCVRSSRRLLAVTASLCEQRPV